MVCVPQIMLEYLELFVQQKLIGALASQKKVISLLQTGRTSFLEDGIDINAELDKHQNAACQITSPQ